jgi:hypothetical protein
VAALAVIERQRIRFVGLFHRPMLRRQALQCLKTGAGAPTV